MIMTWVTPCGW